MLCVVKKERKVKHAEIMADNTIITREFSLFVVTSSLISFFNIQSLFSIISYILHRRSVFISKAHLHP